MKLDNGFYAVISHLNNKYQSINKIFEIKDKDNIIVYDFAESFLPHLLDICLEPSNTNKLSSTDEAFIRSFLQSNTDNDITEEIMKIPLKPGYKFFNIYRPLLTPKIMNAPFNIIDKLPSIDNYVDSIPISNQEYNNLLCQFEIVLDDLINVFKTVAPYQKNKNCFGHNIRNVIILACTEIDAMMQNILKKNKIKPTGKFYTTKDYYKLVEILKLKDYSIRFRRYHDLNEITPFKNWNQARSTKSLAWYDSYNRIKHDREKEFKLANIENAINSVAAYAITLIAQFGYRNILWNNKINQIIEILAEPQWKIEDFYIPRRSSDVISDLYGDAKPYPKKLLRKL
ncbi:hypothetical protein OXV71_19125 [Bacteroides fragilis]|jgi:hypothetical protein|nr:hypothetical protein [Bacteroides fragilis]